MLNADDVREVMVMLTGGLLGGLIGGIGAAALAIYFNRAKGVDLLKRRAVAFGIIGVIFLVIGFFLMIAIKFLPHLEKKAGLLVAIGMVHLLFGLTCLIFSDVYRTMRQLRKKIVEQELPEKTIQTNETKSV